MTQAAIGPVDNALSDQVLVSTPYLEVVLGELAKLNIGISPDRAPEISDALGLTRIFLDERNLGGANAKLVDSESGTFKVGLILKALRANFTENNAGWCPTIGKNRALVDNVINTGSMIYRSALGDPEPLKGKSLDAATEKWMGRPTGAGQGVRVGVIDTRVYPAATLGSSIIGGEQNLLPGDVKESRAGHGTFVTGVIVGCARGVSVEVRGILNDHGESNSWDAANAIVELGNAGVDILNLSFGCVTGNGKPPLALATAIDLVDPRTLIVAAAGNFKDNEELSGTVDGVKIKNLRDMVSFPAALDNVIAVGSSATKDNFAYSPAGIWVDVFANGTDVISTLPPNQAAGGFAEWTGTSFSAALITGLIASETKPGEVSARQAWQLIKARFTRANTGAIRPVDAGASTVAHDSEIVVHADPWYV